MDTNNSFFSLGIICVIIFVAAAVIRSASSGSSGGGRNMDPDAKVIGHRAEVVRSRKKSGGIMTYTYTIKNSVTFSDGYISVVYGGATTTPGRHGTVNVSQSTEGILIAIGAAITDHDKTVKSWNKNAVKSGKTIIDIPELDLHGTLGELRKKVFVQTWTCAYCGGETSLDKYECDHCGRHKA